MPKNMFTDPDYWGSSVGELVEILNSIDIPLEFKDRLQEEIECIASGQESSMESAWGRDV